MGLATGAEFALLDFLDYRYNPSRFNRSKQIPRHESVPRMAEDFRELEEQAEEAAQHNLAPVTVTMAILAVLVAAVSLLGHRAHTEEMLMQTKATDHWAYYQAKEIRRRTYELFEDEMSVFALQNSPQVDKIKQKYENTKERVRIYKPKPGRRKAKWRASGATRIITISAKFFSRRLL
jgi:hypothetical protein